MPGVTPAAVSILLVHLKKRARAARRRSHERLHRASCSAPGTQNDSLVCVGLDPEIERFPRAHRRPSPRRSSSSTRRSSTPPRDLVCAYKPQFAHYAAYEAEDQLERTIEYIHRTYPGVPVILDAKRGDVGNTAERYAIEAFERYGADAVTVNPYLGGDALEPFLRHADSGVIVLCRTSNPGRARPAGSGGRRRGSSTRWWRELAAARWNARGNCLLVVGATYPRELAEVRALVGDMPLLVPGVGAQGGDVAQAVQQRPDRAPAPGLIVSSSRGILYAVRRRRTSPPRAALAALALREQINASRTARAHEDAPGATPRAAPRPCRWRLARSRCSRRSQRQRGRARRAGARANPGARRRPGSGLARPAEGARLRGAEHAARPVRGTDHARPAGGVAPGHRRAAGA